ncbi:YceG-like family protein [Cytobacillus firmus]|uniref:YceG-like family protein n=2 Tax=Cytobacillus TaxID=2675230 RepID=A0A366JXN8_CYTFI|nr:MULTISPECIES: endolytic transglycosylase MltG [Cytobacillus]RBP94140.1 YceG-like family protein [Cytobacillus firmus]TDX47446.1 YceG-like family protein [Cytobacillus oceanisediminis]
MNKRNTRAFAFGILTAVIAFGTPYFFIKPKQSEYRKIDDNSAKEFLQANGYTVMTDEEYTLLQQTKAEDPANKNTEEKEEPAEKNAKPEEGSQEFYQLTIESGMTPGEIAAQLEKANVIDQAADFGIYLEEYGYSKKIQQGTFELTTDMSYKEIAKIITKS